MIGGTVNETGSFLMRAVHVGEETVLSRIIEMVAQAQRSRAPIQRVADVAASWFVPAVIGVAVVAFGAWAVWGPEPRLAYALVNAVAVLIIACPCALGLATPMSIMVGVGRGAKEGVLIKNAEALEILQKADTLIIDKTGTLTEGRPTLTETVLLGSMPEEDAATLVASLEQQSEHPLARVVVNTAKAVRGASLDPVERFESTTEQVECRELIAGRRVVAGNLSLLQAQDVQNLDSALPRAKRSPRTGSDNHLCGD